MQNIYATCSHNKLHCNDLIIYLNETSTLDIGIHMAIKVVLPLDISNPSPNLLTTLASNPIEIPLSMDSGSQSLLSLLTYTSLTSMSPVTSGTHLTTLWRSQRNPKSSNIFKFASCSVRASPCLCTWWRECLAGKLVLLKNALPVLLLLGLNAHIWRWWHGFASRCVLLSCNRPLLTYEAIVCSNNMAYK